MDEQHTTFEERDAWTQPTPGKQLFTFGLVYKHGDDEYVEEIDVYADYEYVARRRAELIAREDYEPGYDRMIDMSPGGSAGTVTWISS